MTEEIIDDKYAVSIPCVNSKTTLMELNITADLPTRVKLSPHYSKFLSDASQGKCNDNFYSGNLLKFKAADGTIQDPVAVEVVHLPFEKQIVVDGYICPKQLIDNETGLCTYDKVLEELIATPVNSIATPESNTRTLENDSEPNNNKNFNNNKDSNSVEAVVPGKKKCPICLYIENGPCKSQFNDWEKCISALEPVVNESKENASNNSESTGGDVTLCFEQTKAMMKCFMQYEYYDVMTAGMHDKMNVAFASSASDSTTAHPYPVSTSTRDVQTHVVDAADISGKLSSDMDSNVTTK